MCNKRSATVFEHSLYLPIVKKDNFLCELVNFVCLIQFTKQYLSRNCRQYD